MIISEDITQEELEVFLQEADEQLQLLDEDFITLEKEGVTTELLQEIFRAAHTLKGSSAMLGYEKMSHVAHAMETLLDRLRNNTMSLNTSVIDALLHGIDILKSLKQALISGESSNIDIISVITELERVTATADDSPKDDVASAITYDDKTQDKLISAQEKGQNIYSIALEVIPTSTWAAVRLFQVIQELSKIGEVIHSNPSEAQIKEGKTAYAMNLVLSSTQEPDSIKDKLTIVPELCNLEIISNNLEEDDISPLFKSEDGDQPIESNSPGTQKSVNQKYTQISQTVRVDVELLDKFMNLIGEMVIDRNRIVQISKILQSKFNNDETIDALSETSTRMGKLISSLQENIYKARMLPIATVFNTFPRMIRDMAQKADKKINFVIEGQETELDRTIIEKIRDPLLHLLRNSVDHGIETREKRLSAGKNEEGTIRLTACQEQNTIVVTVEDDGGGIDIQAVRDAAVKQELHSAEELSKMTDTEVMSLIYYSGLSTAGKTTEVSGRGVGMDAVRANIESLGATIDLETKVGEGTKFTIRLPLTLATIEGLLVSSGNAIYIIPMNSVVEVSRIDTEQIRRVMRQDVIRFRDDVLPLHRLNKVFGQNGNNGNGNKKHDETLMVVVKGGDKQMGIIVDSVIEPQETVVKSLGSYLGAVKGIAGATILGDGHVALIIDTASLLKGISNTDSLAMPESPNRIKQAVA